MIERGVATASAIPLSPEEVDFLRFTCDLYADEESPLGPVPALEDTELIHRAARSLVDRGLADTKTLRPDRDLLRRLLIVSQPDARIVLTRSSGRRAEPLRVLDAYERAGALVRYQRRGEQHLLSPAEEYDGIFDEIRRQFAPRRSTGDFVDFTLTTAEYFAFSILAGDLSERAAARPSVRTEPLTVKNLGVNSLGPEVAVSKGLADEGTPIHNVLERLPLEDKAVKVPSKEDWDAALTSLEKKEILVRTKRDATLRPYLHDLASGLAARRRLVLTRFDFGAEDWFVRDATFIGVPGSIFLLRATQGQGIRVVEVDSKELDRTIRQVTEPLGSSETIEAG
ncbi:MAG: ESX secretion-associated protein EspG [Deltaproteobacteria bacterium]|nr:ESX secretion-associated protein EspG [Deltaproteobacteria bacterium]